MTETSVIQAIDSANRIVTLKNEDGTIDTVYCGPEVQRDPQSLRPKAQNPVVPTLPASSRRRSR